MSMHRTVLPETSGYSVLRLVASLMLTALMISCGPSEQGKSQIGLNNNAIVWRGFADADPRLKKDLAATVDCLQQHSLKTRQGFPFVVVVHGTIDCHGTDACGCTEMNGATIFMDDQYLYTYAFSHELVHWETGMGNEYHNSVQFEYCSHIENF